MHRSTGDPVYQLIRDGILNSRFEAGHRLSLESLAAEAGCTLTAVRRAVERLSEEGLVEVRPRSGSYVSSVTACELAEICDVRRALECLAAEAAVQRITLDQLSRIRMLVLEMGAPVLNNQQRDRHEAMNTEFHRLLVQAAGNKVLLETYDALKVHIQIARLHALGRLDWKKRLPQECLEHQAILHALQIRDSDRLKVVLRNHIDRSKEAMILAVTGRS